MGGGFRQTVDLEPSVKTVKFSKLSKNVDSFFDILPKDWSDEIAPKWEMYARNSQVYVLTEEGQVIGGGILFSTASPDLEYSGHVAKEWFEKGYKYIAYFYIVPSRRGEGLGRKWLDELQKTNPDQSLFLTIDDYALVGFYEKADFTLLREIITEVGTEWLMVKEA